MNELKTIAKNFVNLFYPLHCLGCGAALDALDEFRLCDRCIAAIKPNAMPPFGLERSGALAYSACLYEGTLKELIHSFKYRGKTTLSRIFAKLMIGYIEDNPEIADADIVTAVPLHRSRLKEREFNQSLLIAERIAKKACLPVRHTLEKIRKTEYQNELLKGQRLTNLKGAFMARDNTDIKGAGILLVDDVITTGATLDECACALLSGGARRVTCFALARGII